MTSTSPRRFTGATAGVALAVLVLTQTACGTEPPAIPKLEPISIPPPSVATPPSSVPTGETSESGPPEVGTVVYEHDFSSPENGLLGGQSSDSATNDFGSRSATYTERGTLIVRAESELDDYVGGANTEDLAVDGRALNDLSGVSIEVDATPLDIGGGAAWGLACRRDREIGAFYFAFVGNVGGLGQAGIVRQDEPGGEWTAIATSIGLPGGLAVEERATNRLRLDCIGSDITLYADGREVVHGTDAGLESGGVALFVNPRPPQSSSAEVEFDNLVLREA
jgi:hypothetical protein